jgi:hypothetical protein
METDASGGSAATTKGDEITTTGDSTTSADTKEATGSTHDDTSGGSTFGEGTSDGSAGSTGSSGSTTSSGDTDGIVDNRLVCDCYIPLTQGDCVQQGGCIWDPGVQGGVQGCSPSLCGIPDPTQCDAAKLCSWTEGACYGPDGMEECVTVCGCYAQSEQDACIAHGGCTWNPQTHACSYAECGGLAQPQCDAAKICTFVDGRCYPAIGGDAPCG